MQRTTRSLALCLAMSAGLGTAQAAEVDDLAAKFGAMPTVQTISLSPDGTKVAYTQIQPFGTVLLVADIVKGGEPKPAMWVKAAEGTIRWCAWSTSARLVCQASVAWHQVEGWTTATRMFALNADGKQVVQLSKETSSRSHYTMYNGGSVIAYDLPGEPGAVLMTRSFVPDTQIGSRVGSDDRGFGVEAVDTVTLKRRRIEAPAPTAVEYIADGQGTVRIKGTQATTDTGYAKDTIRYSYRQSGVRDWTPLSSLNALTGLGFNPYAVDSQANVASGFDQLDGRSALYKVALDGSLRKDLVLAKPDVDVDSLIWIGRSRRVVGVSYATDRRVVEYSDPEIRKLSAGLAKALPGQPQVDIVDASQDETKLLLVASGDTHPGMTYVYTKADRHLTELMPIRAALEGVTLAKMKPITFTARDGTAVPGYLTLPPGSNGKGLPAIVMPHGGPSSRDEWGFDWLVQFFALRGFAVLQPNYRGSSGYGAAWFEKNGFQSWRTAMNDIIDAGRWLQHEGVAAPDKLAIVGWSYGGYAALQTAVVDPDVFKAIVAVAPVTDLDQLKAESEYFSNHRLAEKFIGTGPHIAEGSPARHADRITAPVLLFHGDRDQNVGVAESQLMERRLKQAGKSVVYVEFAGLDHQLESTEARTKLLSQSDAFLRTALGLK